MCVCVIEGEYAFVSNRYYREGPVLIMLIDS